MDRKEDVKQNKYLLWGITLSLTAAYAGLCFNDSVWADEAYTMLLVQKPWPEAWKLLLSDVHPPLYYIIVKLVCTVFGYPVPVVKGISVFFVFLTMTLGIVRIYPDFGKKTAAAYIAAVGLMPQLIRHGVELRMYPQAMFFVTACGLLAFSLWRHRTERGLLRNIRQNAPTHKVCFAMTRFAGFWRWTGFWIFGVAAAYTHYYALISVAWIYGFLLLAFFMDRTVRKAAIWRWLICLFASIAAYLPWLFVFVGQAVRVEENYWIERPSVRTAIRWAGWLFKTEAMVVSVLFTVIFAFGFFWLLWRGIARHKEELMAGAAGYGVLLMTVLTGAAASILFRPVFVPRYMIPAAGLAAFGLAVFASRLPRQMTALLCGMLLLIGGLGYRDVWKEEYGIRTAQTRSELRQLLKPGDRLVYDYEHIGLVLEYYYPDYDVEYWEDADWNESGDIWYCQVFNELTEERMEEMELDWTLMGEYGLDEYSFRLYRIRFLTS